MLELWSGSTPCTEVETVRASDANLWRPWTPTTTVRHADTWLRVLLPLSAVPLVLSVPTDSARQLYLYRPGTQRPELRDVYAPRRPYTGSAVWHWVPLDAGEPGELLICLSAPRVRPAQVEILPLPVHVERELWVRSLIVGSLAAMLAAFGFALALWFSLRDRVYLYYLGHVVSFLLWHGTTTWWAVPALRHLPGHPELLSWWPLFFAGLAVWFTGGFLRRFLDLRRTLPWADRVVVVGSYAVLTMGVVSILVLWRPELRTTFVQGQNVLIGLVTSLTFGAAVVQAIRGQRLARYVVAAWSAFFVLVIASVIASVSHADSAQAVRLGLLPAAALETILLSIGLADRTYALRRERDRAQRMAERDGLTEVLNRRGLERVLGEALARPEGGCVLFCDLDHFKQINDRFGHPIGDRCLQAFVERAATILPPDAELARFGGEEFAVVLSGRSAAEGVRVAEQLRGAIAMEPVQVDDLAIGVTVSIGVTPYTGRRSEALDAVIGRADAAVYRAKAAGRDRVELSHPVLSPH